MFYACYVISAKCFYNSNIYLIKNVKDTCYYTILTGFGFLFSRFEDTDFCKAVHAVKSQKSQL